MIMNDVNETENEWKWMKWTWQLYTCHSPPTLSEFWPPKMRLFKQLYPAALYCHTHTHTHTHTHIPQSEFFPPKMRLSNTPLAPYIIFSSENEVVKYIYLQAMNSWAVQKLASSHQAWQLVDEQCNILKHPAINYLHKDGALPIHKLSNYHNNFVLLNYIYSLKIYHKTDTDRLSESRKKMRWGCQIHTSPHPPISNPPHI